ncbi:MAG TPA: alpha/beta hydrolase, partial [Pseudonocardia sp.]|nr:alpha/beta hydrolase [Pseudonocardia sp.]
VRSGERATQRRGSTAPVLHVVGDADRFTPATSLSDAREQCTGWYTMSTVRGVGHYPAEEAPDLVTRLIVSHAERSQQP